LCRETKGAKLNLLQSEDGHILGSFNTDTCWEGAPPNAILTPFSFSLNTTERLLFLTNPDAKMRRNEKPGFIFGKSVWIRPRKDAQGIEACFHRDNNEMGRMMSWLNVGPGKCFSILKLEQFRV